MNTLITAGWGASPRAPATITPGAPIHTAMSETTYSPEHRKIRRDPAVIAPAFVHLALQGPQGLDDRYVDAWELTRDLAKEPRP